MEDAKKNAPKISLHITPEKQTGVYANAVSVQVKENDVVLDFGYVLPGVQPPTIEIVSRINLSHKTAEQFLNVLQNSILDYRNRSKKT